MIGTPQSPARARPTWGAVITVALTVALLLASPLVPGARADGLPTGPSYVSGQQGDQSVVVTWGPPAGSDYASVTGFVACVDAARCVTLDRTEFRTTFTGLTNGQRYFPYVAATSSSGAGPSVAVAGGVLAAGVPGAPLDVDVVARPGGVARISWSGVDGRGQAPYSFTVRQADGSDPHSLGVAEWDAAPPDPEGAGHYFVDMNLYPGREYELTVTATNGTGTGPASAISFVTGDPYLLLPGDVLYAGESISSISSVYYLTLQNDGNLVLYHHSGRPVWHSWTWGRPGGRLAFQEDGNLVAYGQNGQVLWHSDTWGHPDAALNINDDGRVVVFDGSGNTLWSSRADQGQYWPWNSMEATEQLTAGQTLYSANSAFRLTMQADGNAVVYGPNGRVMWHSWTFGRPGSRLVMQEDGNLVVILPDRRAGWHASTWGNDYSRVVMQDDGNLVVYSSAGRALWSSMYGRSR